MDAADLELFERSLAHALTEHEGAGPRSVPRRARLVRRPRPRAAHRRGRPLRAPGLDAGHLGRTRRGARRGRRPCAHRLRGAPGGCTSTAPGVLRGPTLAVDGLAGAGFDAAGELWIPSVGEAGDHVAFRLPAERSRQSASRAWTRRCGSGPSPAPSRWRVSTRRRLTSTSTRWSQPVAWRQPRAAWRLARHARAGADPRPRAGPVRRPHQLVPGGPPPPGRLPGRCRVGELGARRRLGRGVSLRRPAGQGLRRASGAARRRALPAGPRPAWASRPSTPTTTTSGAPSWRTSSSGPARSSPARWAPSSSSTAGCPALPALGGGPSALLGGQEAVHVLPELG